MEKVILIVEEAVEDLLIEAEYYKNTDCFATANDVLTKLKAYKEVLELIKGASKGG